MIGQCRFPGAFHLLLPSDVSFCADRRIRHGLIRIIQIRMRVHPGLLQIKRLKCDN